MQYVAVCGICIFRLMMSNLTFAVIAIEDLWVLFINYSSFLMCWNKVSGFISNDSRYNAHAMTTISLCT